MNELIIGLNLSILFAFSILTINLIGIIISEYIKTKNLTVKKLQRTFICFLILIEIAIISGFLKSVLGEKSYIWKFNLIVTIMILAFYIFIIFYFWELLNKKLIFLNLLFGVMAVIGVIGNSFFDSIIFQSIYIIGFLGLMIFVPLLVIKLLIDNSEKSTTRRILNYKTKKQK